MSVSLGLAFNQSRTYISSDTVDCKLCIDIEDDTCVKEYGLILRGVMTIVAASAEEKEARIPSHVRYINQTHDKIFEKVLILTSLEKCLAEGTHSLTFGVDLPPVNTLCSRADATPLLFRQSLERLQNYPLPPSFEYDGKEKLKISYSLVPFYVKDEKQIEGHAALLKFEPLNTTISQGQGFLPKSRFDLAVEEYAAEGIVHSQWHEPFPIISHYQEVTLGLHFKAVEPKPPGGEAKLRVLAPHKNFSDYIDLAIWIPTPKVIPQYQGAAKRALNPQSMIMYLHTLQFRLVRRIVYKLTTKTVIGGEAKGMLSNTRNIEILDKVKTIINKKELLRLVLNGRQYLFEDGSGEETRYVWNVPPSWLEVGIPKVVPAFSTPSMSVSYCLSLRATLSSDLESKDLVTTKLLSPVVINEAQWLS